MADNTDNKDLQLEEITRDRNRLLKKIVSYFYLYGYFLSFSAGFTYFLRVAREPLNYFITLGTALILIEIFLSINHSIISKIVSEKKLLVFDSFIIIFTLGMWIGDMWAEWVLFMRQI